ncbi:hypothetical protein KIS4809_1296 [Bacillus sp. ZZV12-4809]|nr:hypothetical protein KIS4809_1296 [Bacillus sp. ZZV12-4809]
MSRNRSKQIMKQRKKKKRKQRKELHKDHLVSKGLSHK